MTRLFFVLLLVASASFGQTYVRPSKGTPITPFAANDGGTIPLYDGGTIYDGAYLITSPYLGSWPRAPRLASDGGTLFDALSAPYDWSAFEAVRIRVYGTGGSGCEGYQSQYNVADIGPYMRVLSYLRNLRGTLYAGLIVYDAPTPAGPWQIVQSPNGSVDLSQYIGCNFNVLLTPIPFSPSTVYPYLGDGGYSIDVNATVNVSVTTSDGGMPISAPYCTQSRSSASSVGTSVVAMPADGGLAGRWMVRLCNSPRNSGTPIVTCSVLTVPDAGTLSDGEALEVGDCATWTTGEQVYCISDTASTAVSSWECR